MKKISLITILIIFYFSSKSQNYYFQYFDGANIDSNNSLIINIDPTPGNIWQIGPPQKILFNSANTLPKAIITDTLLTYPINNLSRFSFAVKSEVFGPGPFALQWTQKLDLDQGLDGGIVEFSTDNITWQNAHNNPNVYQFYGFNPSSKDTLPSSEYVFSGTDNTWRDVWLCLSPTIAQSTDTLFFRFTLKSDGIHSNKEGWIIDNFIAHHTIVHPVKEISQIDNIVVYPNISTGMVNIEMKKTKDSDMIDNIEMIDESGKIVERFGKNYTKVVLDIKKHKAGLYYFRVTTNNKPKLFKVIYEKN